MNQLTEQFIKDGLETKGNTLNGKSIEELYQAFKKDTVEVGNIVVSTDFSAKGGNITIRKIIQLEKEWEGYGEFLSSNCAETAILVEHPAYNSKDVQPFDRQAPFYIGYGFAQLNKTQVNGWNVYNSQHTSKLTFMPQEFYHNTYWDKVRFSVVLKEDDVAMFLNRFLEVMNIPSDVSEIIQKASK